MINNVEVLKKNKGNLGSGWALSDITNAVGNSLKSNDQLATEVKGTSLNYYEKVKMIIDGRDSGPRYKTAQSREDVTIFGE